MLDRIGQPYSSAAFVVPSAAPPATLTWSDLNGFLRRYRQWIAAACLLSTLIALTYARMTTPTYFASNQILIESRLPQALREQLGEATLVLDSPAIESQIAMLRSGTIADKVFDKLKLTDDLELVPKQKVALLDQIKSLFLSTPTIKHSDELTQQRRNQAVDNFHDRLDVRRYGLSYVLEVGYRSADPQQAARIVNAVADAFLADQVNQKTDAARQASNWRDDQIGAMRNQMNGAYRSVQEYKARRDYRLVPHAPDVDPKSANADPDAAGKREPVTLDELEVTAQAYRKVYESNLQIHADLVQRQFLQFSNARVITPAIVPRSPDTPRTGLITIIGGIGGLLLATAVALLHTAFDSRIRTATGVEGQLGLDCIAEIDTDTQGPAVSWTHPWITHRKPVVRAELRGDIPRLYAAIEQRASSTPTREIICAASSVGDSTARIAFDLAQHYQRKGSATLLITSPYMTRELKVLSAMAHDVTSGQIVRAPEHARQPDLLPYVNTEAAATRLSELGQYGEMISRPVPRENTANTDEVQPKYDVIIHAFVPAAEPIERDLLNSDTVTILIVSDRGTATLDDVRAAVRLLPHHDKNPPQIVLAGPVT